MAMAGEAAATPAGLGAGPAIAQLVAPPGAAPAAPGPAAAGSLATIPQAAEVDDRIDDLLALRGLCSSAPWYCFQCWGGTPQGQGCTLACCKVTDSNLLLEPTDSHNNLITDPKKKRAAQLKMQRADILDRHFPTLELIPAGSPLLKYNVGSTEMVFEGPITIGKQLLTQSYFRWFAGLNHEELQKLLAEQIIHYKALLQRDEATGNFRVHAVNYAHLVSKPNDLQKFLAIAEAGRIAHLALQKQKGASTSPGDASGSAIESANISLDIDRFQSVAYCSFKPGGALTKTAPFVWGDHAAEFAKFYELTCIVDPRTALITLLGELRGSAFDTSSVQDDPIQQLLTKITIEHGGKERLGSLIESGEVYFTMTHLFAGAAKLFRTTAAFDSKYVTAEKGQGKKRKHADPSAEEVERVKEYLEKSGQSWACGEAANAGDAADAEAKLSKGVWGVLKALNLCEMDTLSDGSKVDQIKALYEFFGGDYEPDGLGRQFPLGGRKEDMAGHTLDFIGNVVRRPSESELDEKF